MHSARRPSCRRVTRSGFTLIEVLLVLAILGVIAAMVVPNLLGKQEQANIKATGISIKGFEEAVKLYAVDHDGQFPEGNGDAIIQLLMTPEQTAESATPRAPYLEKVPLDAWKQPLRYEFPASGNRQSNTGKPAIWSAGPDRQDDTADDINNWSQI
jgi:general secretion pathway protein G